MEEQVRKRVRGESGVGWGIVRSAWGRVGGGGRVRGGRGRVRVGESWGWEGGRKEVGRRSSVYFRPIKRGNFP